MWSNYKNTKDENQDRNKYKILQNYGSSSTFIWQRNMDTEKERLEQNSSGRDEMFKKSYMMH
jgi:hypothetical protein